MDLRQSSGQSTTPIEALREAIINALVHRDWHSPNAILARMFGSHIDILSPGELLRPLKIEEIAKDDYVPVSRNKTVIEAFGLSGIMDKRGTGFLRIREAMKKRDLPIPIFEEKTGYFRIRFTNPLMQSIPVVEVHGLNERQKRAVAYLRTNKLAPRDYRKLFDVSDKTARSDLKDMEKRGHITFVGSKKTGYYILKLPDKLPDKNEEDNK